MNQAQQDQLVDSFAEWLSAQGNETTDPQDVRLLLDWKRDYGDNQPFRWRLADIDAFLLEYCPRKLSVPPELAVRIPAGVADAMVYLGERGLLRRGSEPAKGLAEHALSRTDEFIDSMSNPALFGMAKSMFALGGGLEPDFDITAPGAIDQLIDRANSRMSELPAAPEPLAVGPVTMPDDNERRRSAATAPVLRRFELLHEACAMPGLKLTKTGNPNLTDARRLVELLDTGDSPDNTIGDRTYRLRTAADLRGLTRWIEWALAAGVVRRKQGRMVAVGVWLKAAKDPVAALDRAVDALLRIGPVSIDQHWELTATLATFVESGAGRILAELLGIEEPVELDDVCEMVAEVVRGAVQAPSFLSDGFVPSLVRDLFDRFDECGLVLLDGITIEQNELGLGERSGGTVRLTPAGVAVAARLAAQLGIEVLERPDPATATAAQLADLAGVLGEDDWTADVRTWAAGRAADEAAMELVAALADRPDYVVLGGLESLPAVFGAAATPAVRTLLGGPADPLAVLWLSQHGGLDPATVEPPRLLAGAVALFAAMLDLEGIAGLLAALDGGEADGPAGRRGDGSLATVEQLWRSAHPRTGEVLTIIGAHHPDKRLAKAAKKSAFKFNNRTG